MLKKVSLFFLLLLIFEIQAIGQSVGVQVTVLPPYQVNIADYRSRPSQVVIVLTNFMRTAQFVQLTGSITGDNGVSITAKPGYKSGRPIQLEPLEVKRVTAEDVMQLFDINSVVLQNVKAEDLARTGMLPEGMYQICIQALDYQSLQPISADAPGGCSNVFPVQSLEPPTFIRPIAEEEIIALAPQNILFTWTTPPSAPPSTEYVFKMVELLSDRNPNDAMLSNTGINAFEEVVRGNSFLYGPAYAPLVEGRRYAVQVTARSPFNNAIFRNGGKSEVIVFTYGSGGKAAAMVNVRQGDGKQTQPPTPIKYASNLIKGKLVWSFRESEDQTTNKSIVVTSSGIKSTDPGKVNTTGLNGMGIQTAVSSYYMGENTLQMSSPLRVAKADPTLNVASLLNVTTSQPSAEEVISSTGSEQVTYNSISVSDKKSAQQYPLAGVTITIRAENNANQTLITQVNNKSTSPAVTASQSPNPSAQIGLRSGSSLMNMLGVSSGGNQQNNTQNNGTLPKLLLKQGEADLLANIDLVKTAGNDQKQADNSTLLATARTDQDGNYTAYLLHPEFEGLNRYTHLVVAVKTDDFDEKEFRIPISELDLNETIDLGTHILAARTYRFTPTINLEKPANSAGEASNFKVNIYRPISDIQQYSYLQKEGMMVAGGYAEKTINGRKMRLVASQDVVVNKNGITNSATPSHVFSGLFYTGRLYLEIEPVKANYQRRETDIAVQNFGLPVNNVLQVNASYRMSLVSPSVSGQVIVKGSTGMEPIANAVVKVSFNPDDVEVLTLDGFNLGLVANSVRTAQVLSTSMPGTQPAGTLSSTPNNNVSLFAAASLTSSSSIAKPVVLTNTSITDAKPVLSPADQDKQSKDLNLLTMPNLSGKLPGLAGADLTQQYGAYAVRTDASGQFYIGNLPVLKEGKSYTLTLLDLPKQYQDMEIAPANKQHTFLIAKGEQVTREFVVKPELYQLVGRVVDKEGKPLSFARLHFKGSSNYFDAGESGVFETSYFAGNHTLQIEKQGYVSVDVKVSIGKKAQVANPAGDKKNSTTKVPAVSVNQTASNVLTLTDTEQWTQQLKNTPTVIKAQQEGYSFSPQLFGHATPTPVVNPGVVNNSGAPQKEPSLPLSSSFIALTANTFRAMDLVQLHKDFQDIGDVGYLVRKTGKVLFRVEDKKTGKAISGATISLFDTSNVSNAAGQWKYEGFGGQTIVRVSPPASSGYVVLETSLVINETGIENTVVLKLDKGIRVSGKVTSGANAVPNASITPEGLEYAKVTTGDDGSYELFLPAGSVALKASRSGYISKTVEATIADGKENTIHFDLRDGGGKNISHLLGFEIELEKTVPDGNGELWTGRFVNLKPVSSAFVLSEGSSLSFTNVKVSFDNNGNAKPQNNEVQTDEVNLPVKLFGYLPLTFSSREGLKVIGKPDGKGYIAGSLKLSTHQLPVDKGFKWTETASGLFVLPQDLTDINDVRLFTTEPLAQQAYSMFKFALPDAKPYSLNLYGFNVILDLAQSKIAADRVQLAGSLATATIGPISSVKFTVQELVINKNMQVQTVKIKTDNLPKMDIAGWGAELQSLVFSEGRFKLGGKLSVAIPSSGTSSILFSDLSLMADALYGGNFSFPDNGINLLNIVKMKPSNEPLHFGRVGNTNVYSLNGSASIQFDKFITKKIDIPMFQVQTDGRFMLEAPANFTADAGFAKLAVQNILVNTGAGQTPSIGVVGEFKADLDMLKFSVGDIRFKAKAGGGTEFSVSKIGAELDIPVFKAGLTLGIKENGFEGTGSMGVPSTPINADIAFHYFKNGNNLDVGASFKTGIVIPIGIVTIEKVGGGFSIRRPARSLWSISTVLLLLPVSEIWFA